MRTARDAEVRLGGSYLDEGWLEHGYALTAHAAHCATVDRSFVLGSDELYCEWGYAALSRHRDQARFYVVSPRSVERALPGLETGPDDLDEDVVATLSTSRTKDMALDVLARGGVAGTVDALDEVALAEQRIARMQAERDGLSRLRRSRRAAIEQDIAQQHGRSSCGLPGLTRPPAPSRSGRRSHRSQCPTWLTVTQRAQRCSTRAAE
ncbi:MAG: Conjugal transfer protein traA [Conexibacter sp.]|nr:Conjugal transfer protein traA [Conexibacter sp.]